MSEEDDTVYRLKLDSLEHVTAAEFAPRAGSSVVTDAAGNVYVAGGSFTSTAQTENRLAWWRFRAAIKPGVRRGGQQDALYRSLRGGGTARSTIGHSVKVSQPL